RLLELRGLLDEAETIFEAFQQVAAGTRIDAGVLRVGVELRLGEEQAGAEVAGRADAGQKVGAGRLIQRICEPMRPVTDEVRDHGLAKCGLGRRRLQVARLRHGGHRRVSGRRGSRPRFGLTLGYAPGFPSMSQATGSPRERSRAAGRPSTSSKWAGGRPLPGRTERTLARVSASPAFTSAVTYSERRNCSEPRSAPST